MNKKPSVNLREQVHPHPDEILNVYEDHYKTLNDTIEAEAKLDELPMD